MVQEYVFTRKAVEDIARMKRWFDLNANRLLGDKYRRRGRRGGEDGTGIHHAFCKANATATTTITCYLDTNLTGEEITVHCNISNGSKLSEAARRLILGNRLEVAKIGDEWTALEGFETDENCVCHTS